jgi:phosphate transport system substrate-binding protein
LKSNKLWKWGAAGALVVLSGAVLSGCGGNQTQEPTAPTGTETQNDTAAQQKLTGAGATFPYPLYSKWFDAYGQANGVQINYQSVGSGAGIKELKNGTVDFGASDAPLSDDKAKEMPAPIVQIPTAAGAVAIIYNLKDVETGLKLSGDVIADIYLGKINKWNDPKIGALNAGIKLPATAIAVAHRSDGSGTTNIFTTYLKAVSPAWASGVGAGKEVKWPAGIGGKGNEGVAGVVKNTPGGIGYVELAYATKNNFTYASIRNKSGQFVAPSVDSTVAAAEASAAALAKDVRTPIVDAGGAKSYPISGFTFIMAYKKQKDEAKGKALVDFLKWAMKDGQSMAKPLDYAPLPDAVAASNEKTIAEIQ